MGEWWVTKQDMTKSDFRHIHQMAVRWSDLDALGHVNNAELVRYFEAGRVAYCDSILDLQFGPTVKEAWILADLHCRFRGQLHFPDGIEVATRCSRFGNSSADLAAAIYRKGSNKPFAESKAVVVWFDYINQKSKAIPDDVRVRIREYESVKPKED